MSRNLLALGYLCTLFTSIGHCQLPPEKAAATFTVSPGLEMKLWASEPLFSNPTCIDVDHLGRVWVLESVNYRDTLRNRPLRRPAGDRILILEDSQKTGEADKVTVFYQAPELLAPLGIAVAKDPTGPGWKVFVCQSPDILVFEDKDGDGKADGPPKKLLSGFRGIDHDHGVHGILIGPDNKLYFSVGDQGVAGLPGKNGKVWTSNDTDCRAGTIWRCDQDGKNLELIAHNFRNEYEPCVDSFGSIFVSDNDDDGNQQTRICDVMPGGNYGYHPRGPGQTHWHEEEPGVVPKILRTYFGSPTGMCVYEGKLLPTKYQGQLLHTDAGPRHVRCYHLTPEGASYAVEREDMVTSTDPWFRPSDVCVAPDGSLMVSDWYDPGVGGHGMGDTTRGRIYRIAPTGNKMVVPPVDLTTDAGVLQALGSPTLSVRAMAMATIQVFSREKLESFFRAVDQSKLDPPVKARLYWQVASADVKLRQPHGFELADNLASTVLVTAMKQEDPRFAPFVIRLYRYVLDPKLQNLSTLRAIAKQLGNDSPLVRREMLIALRDTPPGLLGRQEIRALAHKYDSKDRFYLEAIGIAVGREKERREFILEDFEIEFPGWNQQIANLVWELRPPQMMAKVERRLSDGVGTPPERIQLVDIVAGSPEEHSAAVLLAALTKEQDAEVRQRIVAALQAGLTGKWRSLQNGGEFEAGLKTLLDRPETQIAGLKLIAAVRRQADVSRVVALVSQPAASPEVRQEGVRTLAALPGAASVPALEKLLETAPAVDHKAIVQALGKQSDQQRRNGPNQAFTSLTKLVTDDKRDLELRLEAASALSISRPGTLWLLDNMGKKEIPSLIQAEAARTLRNSAFQDVRKRAMAMPLAAVRLDPKKLPDMKTLLAQRGDVKRGEHLMAASLKNELQCLKCHTVNNQGGKIGPDLSAIGKKASRENLIESILLPDKAIADQFVTWIIESNSGQLWAGLAVEDDADHVTLRSANGIDTRIDKKNIASRTKSEHSLMPTGLISFMTDADLTDIVEYLLTLQSGPEPSTKK
jgi:putative membrane-bound dehydrogenase-like protein